MAVVNSKYCVDGSGESINFNGNFYSVGTFLTATESPPASDIINYCFEIIDSTDEPTGTFTATTNTFNSCYDCLANNYTIVDADFCDGTGSIKIDISEFGFIPSAGQIFNLQLTFGRNTIISCIQVGAFGQYSEVDYNSIVSDLYTIDQIFSSNFTTCGECLYGFSAGTESTICVVCCPCTTGETITSVSPPHPSWTNQQGQTIIQLNAITLGGTNGLNN